MTEQELTALAQKWNRYGDEGLVTAVGHDAMALAEGYLALLAERDALKAQVKATQTLAAAGLGRQLHMPPSEPSPPGATTPQP
jgi:hypothetical protein